MTAFETVYKDLPERTQSARRSGETPRPVPAARIARERPDTLDLAALYLPGFDRATMTRRGRLIKLQDLIRQLNPILKAKGIAQVGPKELWV